MPSLPQASEITALTGLLAPGVIILWVRGRFLDSAPPKLTDRALVYAIVSVAYNAAAYPLFHVPTYITLPSWLWQITLNVLLPLLVGIIIVFFDKSERFYKLSEQLGLRPVHHEATAWDRRFRNRSPAYTIVHLSDGSEVRGAWVGDSFASSNAVDRDIFLSEMWRVADDGSWSKLHPPRSILICGGSVRMVEFIEGGSDE